MHQQPYFDRKERNLKLRKGFLSVLYAHYFFKAILFENRKYFVRDDAICFFQEIDDRHKFKRTLDISFFWMEITLENLLLLPIVSEILRNWLKEVFN